MEYRSRGLGLAGLEGQRTSMAASNGIAVANCDSARERRPDEFR